MTAMRSCRPADALSFSDSTTQPIPERLEPSSPKGQVGLEMITLGPFVPGLDPQQTLIGWAVGNTGHSLSNGPPKFRGTRATNNHTSTAGPWRVVPVRVHTWVQRRRNA